MSVFHQTAVATTPLPLPTHFSHAQQSFSLKKRRLPFSSCTSSSSQSPPWPLSHSLPPHPPSKGCPPLSRVFPHRPSPWKPLSRSLIEPPPPRFIYDPSRPQSFFSQCFTNLGLIGRGSFGEVFKVLSLLDGRHYAVKRSVQRFRGEGERARSIKEARNHEGLRPHPHVLGFVAAWEEGGHLYIQTELCCTSLIQHAEEKSSHTGEASAWSYLCDMLSALDHLHAQGFAHLDLKPANIFITKSGRLKLGDFGLLLHIPTGVRKRASEGESELEREQDDLQEGDPRYMAPELLRGEYGTAADIFSLGVSILELACNIEIPKGGEGWQHLRQGYLPAEYTNVLSAELQCVLKHMLSPEPRDRATAQQLVGLPSVCKHMWRRQLTLCVTESFLSLFHFCQSIFTAGWNIISSLNLPFIHLCASATPCTPPRERWERDGDVSALQHSTIHTDFDSPTHDYMFPPEGPDHSPTFSHGVQARSSVGSTSTPLPNMNKHIRGRDTQTHTPSTSPSHTLTSSPSLSPFHSSHYSSLDHLSDSPSSSKSHSQNLNRSWSRTEQSTKTNFEPKNLLNLFDETIDRPLSSDP